MKSSSCFIPRALVSVGLLTPGRFKPAVRKDCGEVVEIRRGERTHAEIIRRIGEDAVEGYVVEGKD